MVTSLFVSGNVDFPVLLGVGAESCEGGSSGDVALRLTAHVSLPFRASESGVTSKPAPPSSVSHTTFLSPVGCCVVYRGDGLFRNLGFLLDEGGENDDAGLLLMFLLDEALTLRFRGSVNPLEVSYCFAKKRKCSRGSVILSDRFIGAGGQGRKGWGAGGRCGVSIEAGRGPGP